MQPPTPPLSPDRPSIKQEEGKFVPQAIKNELPMIKTENTAANHVKVPDSMPTPPHQLADNIEELFGARLVLYVLFITYSMKTLNNTLNWKQSDGILVTDRLKTVSALV